MASISEKYAPYAPAVNIVSLLHRLRERSWPDVLNHQELVRISLPEESTPRIIRALKFLGLINDDGRQTDHAERLRRATDDEYPEILADLLRASYSEVFTACDPSTASDKELHNVFRFYDPQGQRVSMIRLFLGLCQEARIVPEGTVSRTTPARQTQRTASPKSAERRKDTDPPKNDSSVVHGSSLPTSPENAADKASVNEKSSRYAMLYVLLDDLPKDGKWTQRKHDQWLKAVTAGVEYLLDIQEPENDSQNKPQQPELEQ